MIIHAFPLQQSLRINIISEFSVHYTLSTTSNI